MRDNEERLSQLNVLLAKKNNDLTAIIEGISDSFYALDNEWRITYASKSLIKTMEALGYGSDCIGKNILKVYPKIVSTESYRKLLHATVTHASIIFTTKEPHTGKCFTTSVYPYEQGLLVFIKDVSSQQKMEVEMQRLDKLKLVGEMAAGIGHEVRNPMTTVRGYLQMFQRREQFAEYRDQINTMIEELDRANAIITEFLSLAKNKIADLKPANLNDTIHNLFPLMQADAFRLGHEIQVDIGDIPIISYDDKEMRQLILNIVRNGLESMICNGLITIKTYLQDGEIILAIQDTGTGIPKEVLDKIGTPFVTTKVCGTGLGLSVCYRIAERHRAKINISTSSKGTTFFVNFRTVDNIAN